MKKHKQKKVQPHKKPQAPQRQTPKLNFHPKADILPPVANLTVKEQRGLAAQVALETMRDAAFQVLRMLILRGYPTDLLVQSHLALGTILGGLEVIDATDSSTEYKMESAKQMLELTPEAITNMLPSFCQTILASALRHWQNRSPNITTPQPSETDATCANPSCDSPIAWSSAAPCAPVHGDGDASTHAPLPGCDPTAPASTQPDPYDDAA